jgi:aminopeptidase N
LSCARERLAWTVAAALLAACLLALGCRAFPWPSDGDSAEALDGNRRLDAAVVPTHYALDLRIDPAAARFSGSATIRVDVRERTRLLKLHGQGLDITRAELRAGGESRSVVVVTGPNGALALQLSRPLEPGPATLHFEYEADLPETPFGLYRVEVDDRWYAFTQFQPLDARRAFPCFDQPEWKTPYDVTLRVPRGLLAVSNGPEQSREPEGETRVFRFAQTPPLPTYLVAFAVGEFDVADAAGAGLAQ